MTRWFNFYSIFSRPLHQLDINDDPPLPYHAGQACLRAESEANEAEKQINSYSCVDER